MFIVHVHFDGAAISLSLLFSRLILPNFDLATFWFCQLLPTCLFCSQEGLFCQGTLQLPLLGWQLLPPAPEKKQKFKIQTLVGLAALYLQSVFLFVESIAQLKVLVATRTKCKKRLSAPNRKKSPNKEKNHPRSSAPSLAWADSPKEAVYLSFQSASSPSYLDILFFFGST